MPGHIVKSAFAVVVTLWMGCGVAGPAAIPPALEDWRAWALDGQEFLRCPFVATGDAKGKEDYRCAWPGRLALSLDAAGGRFTQPWRVYAESWVRLPGSLEHWPRDVRLDGAPAAHVARDGAPMLLLRPGEHTVTGVFSWATRPESVSMDSRTALVALSIDGREVAQPERPDGAIWLGKRRAAAQAERVEVQVYRLVRDEVPAQLVTQLRLQVAGDARELTLGKALPAGFAPLSLEGDLPARLDSDGRLRIQARPGSWQVTLVARGPGVAERLTRLAPEGPWAKEEVWSFESRDRLRIAAIEGAEGIDPVEANVPEEWRAYPAFRMAAQSELRLVERSRGLQSADDNRLTLRRHLWLDFDHGGWVARDHIQGTMRRGWRLETVAPFLLQSASNAGGNLLVTRNPDGQGVGVEIRASGVSLIGMSRSEGSRDSLPAAGWNTRFDSVQGTANLPLGHRMLAITGADSAPTTWLERWGLWDLFGILVVAVFAGWLMSPVVGAVAFGGLLLVYQEGPAYIWLWANALAAAALARAAPEGRLLGFARRYQMMSLVVLGIALLPLLWGQLRLTLHPQLDAPTPVWGVPQAETAPAASEAPAMAGNAAPVEAIEEVVVRDAAEPERLTRSKLSPGLNYSQVVQRYAPGTLIQTGPGIPDWSGRTYPYSWSGPVESGQQVRFHYIGPVLLGLWRVAGVLLLVALFGALALSSGASRWRPPGTWFDRYTRRGALAACLIGAFLAVAPHDAPAQALPNEALLEELKGRLSRPPDCLPTCADVTAARVVARPGGLDVTLQVSALAGIAVAMPGAGDRWQIETVQVDGRSSLAMTRENDGSLWIALTPGAHTVQLGGRLAASESVQIAFPSTPRTIVVSSEGWEVSGVSEGRLLSGSLELTRRRGASGEGAALEAASEFPAFVRVQRQFDLGLDWNVTTLVERIAPQRAAISTEVPLVAGESVLSEGIKVREGAGGVRSALVGLERGQMSAGWSSGLPRGEALELALPADGARTEVWRFTVSPQWNVEFSGLPAVLPEGIDPASWSYEFHPRPGEKLQLKIRRPDAAEGATLAIDSVRQQLEIGKRSTTTALELRYRSTQGGRHGVTLPADARVTGVVLDGQPLAVRPVGRELSMELRPGSHVARIEWITPSGAGLRSGPPAVDLHSPASNIGTTIDLPHDRWPLFAWGQGTGPAIVYWGELVIFTATAWLLGRNRRSPLSTREWLLLGLGLSTRSWVVLALVALWLFAMRWREGWGEGVSRWRFNAVQVLLAMLTSVAVGSLVFSGIRGSLLASPDMGVQGSGSYGSHFSWFLDRSASVLPQPQVISLPMWCYRALMFAWALWLVFALLKWLRGAWQAWKAGGIWRGPQSTTIAS
jgi:hypothetical protein